MLNGDHAALPRSCDVAIIGGGIVGCAAAYFLARRGASVVLLEKDTVAAEQSSRAWGFVRQQGRDPAEIPLAKAASALWGELAEQLEGDLGFVRGGILAPAETDEDQAKIEAGARSAKEFQLSTRLLGPTEIAALLPELSGRWRSALYTPDDGYADPGMATRAFAAAARRHNVTLLERLPVTGVETSAGAVAGVTTARGMIRARSVICAAGIYAAGFAERLGLSVPVRLIRSSVLETNAARPFTRIAMWAPNVAYRPTDRDSFVIGNGYRGAGADYDITLGSFRHLRHFLPNYLEHWRRIKVGLNREFFTDVSRRLGMSGPTLPEPRINERKIAYNAAQFYRTFPHLDGLGVARVWAGRMDLTPDMLPVIGPIEPVKGFVLAAGFSGHGFALGPIVGKLLGEMLDGQRLSHDIAAFDPHRFDKGRTKVARVGI